MNNNFIVALSCIDSRSSGYIMRSALEVAYKNGFDYIVATPEKTYKDNAIYVNKSLNVFFLRVLDKIFNKLFKPTDGFKSPFLAYKICKIIKFYCKKYKNVIIHVHALHHVPYSMVPVLKYIRYKNLPLVYTFHDVWPFTGGCYNFEQHRCDSYKNECRNCLHGYSHTHKLFKKKIKLLLSINRLVIAPVSQYCFNRINETCLRTKTIELVNVETNVAPISAPNDFKDKIGIKKNNKIVISVCAYWCSLKGVEYLYKIADKLPSNYTLLVIGDGFEKKDYSNIIHIPFVDNVSELPLYFDISDVFVSVTQGDNFPLVLVEAQCCGVPIVGFGHGGTPEEITKESGIMVGTDNNVSKLIDALVYVCEKNPFAKEDIVASGNRFSQGLNNQKYLKIYRSLIKRKGE